MSEDVEAVETQSSAGIQELLESMQPEESPPGGHLGKEEFLQLLVTQLMHQDPLDPMDSRESIAQLAQFSALEQMQNVGSQVEGLRHAQGLTDGLMLQGEYVEALTRSGESHQGTVERITWGRDGLMITIGDQPIALSSIIELRKLDDPSLGGE